MKLSEFLKYQSNEVRGSSSLMAFYLEFYRVIFGKTPNCAGCSFNNDFSKFTNKAKNHEDFEVDLKNIKKTEEMKNEKTFILNAQNSDILTFVDDKGITHRKYDNRMTEEFAVNFLTHGTDEQIAQRKKLFRKLPDALNVDLQAEELAKKEAEELAKKEAEELAKKEAEELAKKEAEELAKKEAEKEVLNSDKKAKEEKIPAEKKDSKKESK